MNKPYKKILIPVLIISAVGGLVGWRVYSQGKAAPIFDSTEVRRSTVVQEVTVTGRVEPVETYDLSFATSGVVKTLAVQEGDMVASGQTLATLEVADVAMQQAQSKAALVGDRQTAEVALQKAEQSLAQTVRVNDIKIEEAKQKVRNAKTKLEIAKEQFDRIQAEDVEEIAASYLSAESAYTSALATYQELQEALQVLQASSTQSEKTAQADVAAARQALQLKQDTITSDGTLSANRAALGYQGAVLSKSVLRAPSAGVVAKVALQVGEYASPSAAVVTLVTPDLHITANVPEADIAKLSLNDTAAVTLDAYGEDAEFAATVASIDEVGTLVEGVAIYEVTFHFTEPDERIKSGMTANTTVHTDTRENVLAVPQRALITRNGDKLVRLVEGDGFREVPVKTGLRGSDGTVEITEGVSEGDRVVVFIEEEQ